MYNIIILDNNISNNGIITFIKYIRYISNINELRIRGNEIKYEGIKEFSENLKYITCCRKLDFCCI